MADLSSIKNILSDLKDNIGTQETNIWYGAMSKNIKNQIENILVPKNHGNISINFIEEQITSLEEAVSLKYTKLYSQVENYANYTKEYYLANNEYKSNPELGNYNVQTAMYKMNNAKTNMENTINKINACLRKIYRSKISLPTIIKEESLTYTIDTKNIQLEINNNRLKKIVAFFEQFITELNKNMFDDEVITRQTLSPYSSISVNVESGYPRSILVSNILDLIEYINRIIAKVDTHTNNIILFENNEIVEIPLENNGTQVVEKTTETKNVTYTVKKGDTLIAIAASYGVSWQALYDANKHKIPDGDTRKLQIGTNLIIPGKTEKVTQTAEVNNEIIGNETLEASREIPTIKPIVDFSKISNSNWAVNTIGMVEGEYSAPMSIENGKMVDKNGNVFYVSSKMSSYYNNGVYDAKGGRSGHTGTDFTTGPNDYGTPVNPLGSGIVIAESDTDNGGFGKYVKVLHEVVDDDGKVKYVVSLYAHLADNNVKVGDIIEDTQTIGRIGSSGNSTGAHLHLEVADVNLTEQEMKNKSVEEVLKIVKQKGIDTDYNYGAEKYYDMGVYFKNKNYLN